MEHFEIMDTNQQELADELAMEADFIEANPHKNFTPFEQFAIDYFNNMFQDIRSISITCEHCPLYQECREDEENATTPKSCAEWLKEKLGLGL